MSTPGERMAAAMTNANTEQGWRLITEEERPAFSKGSSPARKVMPLHKTAAYLNKLESELTALNKAIREAIEAERNCCNCPDVEEILGSFVGYGRPKIGS